MKKKKRFNGLRDYMEKIILEKFKEKSKLLLKDAEFTFLLLDCLSCPYITTETKKSLLTIYKITNKRLQNLIINNKQVWFTQWVDFDFGKALDAKKSQEVY
jgi:signal recognition particle receptor subunit beta